MAIQSAQERSFSVATRSCWCGLATDLRSEQWSLPGGYVEPEETISHTVTREVLEETGVSAEVEGLIGVRSRVFSAENSLYLIFLLRATTDEARPDGAEVLEACFSSLPEAQSSP